MAAVDAFRRLNSQQAGDQHQQHQQQRLLASQHIRQLEDDKYVRYMYLYKYTRVGSTLRLDIRQSLLSNSKNNVAILQKKKCAPPSPTSFAGIAISRNLRLLKDGLIDLHVHVRVRDCTLATFGVRL